MNARVFLALLGATISGVSGVPNARAADAAPDAEYAQMDSTVALACSGGEQVSEAKAKIGSLALKKIIGKKKQIGRKIDSLTTFLEHPEAAIREQVDRDVSKARESFDIAREKYERVALDRSGRFDSLTVSRHREKLHDAREQVETLKTFQSGDANLQMTSLNVEKAMKDLEGLSAESDKYEALLKKANNCYVKASNTGVPYAPGFMRNTETGFVHDTTIYGSGNPEAPVNTDAPPAPTPNGGGAI